MFSIEPPTNCPSCKSLLKQVNNVLYCVNSSCDAVEGKKVEHFAKTLKIKGLGPSTISKLGFSSVCDIYSITEQDIVDRLASLPLGEKVFNEIQLSVKAPANTLLSAFSIPLIGKTAATKLGKVCGHIEDINEKRCKEAGLGPKATEYLMSWLELEFPFFQELPFDFKFQKPSISTGTKGVVCITGKLKSFSDKALATSALEKAGYVVKSTLTKDITVLVNESGIESAKTKKARDSGITIETNILNLIGEVNE